MFPPTRHVSVLIALALTPLLATPATAQTADRPLPESYQGLRSSGAGNSHVAVAFGTDAIYNNPAGIARPPIYVLDAGFSYTPQGSLLSAGISDSKTNPQIAGGATYNYFNGQDEHSTLSGHDVRLAGAIPVVPERLSIGVGGRYLRITDTSLPEVEDDPDAQLLLHGFTLDVGMIVRAANWVQLGLVGQNLIDHCRDNNLCRGTTPTRITGGIGIGDETRFLGTAQASLDLTSADSPLMELSAGIEVMLAQAVPLRVGFERRAYLDRNLLGFGGGWRSERAGLDVSYQHDLNRSEAFGYLGGGFSIYF